MARLLTTGRSAGWLRPLFWLEKVHPKILLKFTRSSCEIYWKFTGNPFEILPKSFEIRSSKTKDWKPQDYYLIGWRANSARNPGGFLEAASFVLFVLRAVSYNCKPCKSQKKSPQKERSTISSSNLEMSSNLRVSSSFEMNSNLKMNYNLRVSYGRWARGPSQTHTHNVDRCEPFQGARGP